jgi:hypothetical protein
MSIQQSEIQRLFPIFAAPLLKGEAAKRFGDRVAKQLAQSFWQAMIDGPKAEANLWKEFEESQTFTPDDAAILRRCFEEEMKPSVSHRQLTAIGEWYLKGEEGKFAVGDQVRVRYGTVDPDYSDLPLGGWSGTIVKINDDGLCNIKLNQNTLDQIHPIYWKRCERDDLNINELDMNQEDLDPDFGEGLKLEEPTDIQTKSLDPNNHEDRIRAALGITTDDVVPFVEQDTLRHYYEHLKANLSFPFPATYWHHDGKRRTVHRISVVGLSKEFPIDDEYGLMCDVKNGEEQWEVPVLLLEVSEKDRTHQLIEDYRQWIAEWVNFDLDQHGHEPEDNAEEDEPEPSVSRKVGRNDPCPCGSGKKFKKCCLKK